MDSLGQNESSVTGWVRRRRKFLLIAVPFLLAVVALALYLTGGRYVSTDDAYVQIAKVQVSANVSARLSDIEVHDNQPVHAGDVLFKLESGRFEIAVREAEAQLAAARQKIQSLQAAYRERVADQSAAEDSLAYQQREYDRQRTLQQNGISSRAQLDQSAHDLAAMRQKLMAAQQQTASAISDLGGALNAPADSQPMVRQAQAALDRAKLDLSYTIVRAPIDGIVTKVDQIQVGNFVQAAAPLFALMSSRDIWVEANFKETDLADIRPGQAAEFSIDAYPGETFQGQVVSASPGTGSSFALLPPENSSGNWVKVVQRLPVRLSIAPKDGLPLRAGMSVGATVDTGHRRLETLWN
jgi:membrane fusion protein (multidrug efflux system)